MCISFAAKSYIFTEVNNRLSANGNKGVVLTADLWAAEFLYNPVSFTYHFISDELATND